MKQILAGWALAAIASQAAAVVESGHYKLFYASSTQQYELDIDQTPAGDYTGAFFTYDGTSIKGDTYNVDEGSETYVGRAGQAFTNATLGGFIPVVGNALGLNQPPANVGSGDFYIATRTGTYTPRNWQVPYTVFGWALLGPDGHGGLKLKASAVAYGETGIVVGSLQAVPEPQTWISMGLGLAAAAAAAGVRRHGGA